MRHLARIPTGSVRTFLRSLPALLLLATSLAHGVTYQIEWSGRRYDYGSGADSAWMRGTFSFPDALLGSGMIRGNQLTSFRIEGFVQHPVHDEEVSIGSFDLLADSPLTPPDVFEFYFDATDESFPVGTAHTQLWASDGNRCWTTGFGFVGGPQRYSSMCLHGWFEETWADEGGLNAYRVSEVPEPAALVLWMLGIGLIARAVAVRARP
ncbi:MAG: PEP-CTERM sorting domain-containing protein [Rubrivivax sp.]|jgi:hypothetical protein|nr:PEP-CTERM sorting domain-containing protein [Rubrivivax sp.]